MVRITIYRHADGTWRLQPDAGDEPTGEPVEAELANGYLAVQGRGGLPRILSTRADELGMTMEQAINRGVVRALPRPGMDGERPTLIDTLDRERNSPK